MGFLFEILAPFLGGMISQLQQDGRISTRKHFFLSWLVISSCFLGMLYFGGATFEFHDFIVAFLGGALAAIFCTAILVVYKAFGERKKRG